MQYAGYTGDVSFTPQNRPRGVWTGCPPGANCAGLGTLPVRSGNYRGAPGKVVMRQVSGRNQDQQLFASLGVVNTGMGGLGDLSDREMCAILATTGGALAQSIGGAAVGQSPTQRQGESYADYQARLASWQQQVQIIQGTSGGLTAAATLCNLIDSQPTSQPTAQSMGLSDVELLRLRMQMQTAALMQQQQSQPRDDTWKKVAIGAGVIGAVGVAAYLILMR